MAILPFGYTRLSLDNNSDTLRAQQTIMCLPVMTVMIVHRGIFPSGWVAKERV